MKAYFHFNQSQQAYIIHQMASYWKSKYEQAEFGGLVIAKEGQHYSYLKNQKEIQYNSLDVVDELEKQAVAYKATDEEVDNWEKRLDFPLWNLVVADRYLGHWFVRCGELVNTDISEMADHDLVKNIACFYLNFFEQRLKAFKPDFVFFPAMASIHSLSLLKMCEFLKIPYHIYRFTRISDRGFISSNDLYERSLTIEKLFNEGNEKETERAALPDKLQTYLDSFYSDRPTKPQWHFWISKQIKSIREQSTFRFFRSLLIGFISACLRTLRNRDQLARHLRYKNPFSNFWYTTRINWSVRYFKEDQFDKVEIGQEKYVFYTLHLDPEATTMIYAPHLTDQRMVVDQLAMNIPLSHKLYVKEHHSMIGRRPKGFYRRLKSNPNVRLISPFVDTFSLIRNASLITVITSTTGWEGMLMGKPVLVLGRCFFTHFKLVEYCHELTELSRKIKDLIYGKIGVEKRRQSCSNLLSIILENSFHIPDDFFWGAVNKPEDLEGENMKVVENMCLEIEKAHKALES